MHELVQRIVDDQIIGPINTPTFMSRAGVPAAMLGLLRWEVNGGRMPTKMEETA